MNATISILIIFSSTIRRRFIALSICIRASHREMTFNPQKKIALKQTHFHVHEKFMKTIKNVLLPSKLSSLPVLFSNHCFYHRASSDEEEKIMQRRETGSFFFLEKTFLRQTKTGNVLQYRIYQKEPSGRVI